MDNNRVKILATVGPSCNNKKSLQKMLDLGVNAFRVNMSHGTKKQKTDKIKLKSTGYDESGDVVSEFIYEWSFKLKL